MTGLHNLPTDDDEVATRLAMKIAGVLHSFLLPRVNCQLRAVSLRKAFASNVPQQDNEEMKEARKWLSSFTPDSIPKQLWVLSFARSSGPGKCQHTYIYWESVIKCSV